jgi:hypothetical protein
MLHTTTNLPCYRKIMKPTLMDEKEGSPSALMLFMRALQAKSNGLFSIECDNAKPVEKPVEAVCAKFARHSSMPELSTRQGRPAVRAQSRHSEPTGKAVSRWEALDLPLPKKSKVKKTTASEGGHKAPPACPMRRTSVKITASEGGHKAPPACPMRRQSVEVGNSQDSLALFNVQQRFGNTIKEEPREKKNSPEEQTSPSRSSGETSCPERGGLPDYKLALMAVQQKYSSTQSAKASSALPVPPTRRTSVCRVEDSGGA